MAGEPLFRRPLENVGKNGPQNKLKPIFLYFFEDSLGENDPPHD